LGARYFVMAMNWEGDHLGDVPLNVKNRRPRMTDFSIPVLSVPMIVFSFIASDTRAP
jgi:hypothetical protein